MYGDATIYGYKSHERVSLDSEGTTSQMNFVFIEVFHQFKMQDNVEGILGLSRGTLDRASYFCGPLFIQSLYNKYLIPQQIFAFYIGGPGQKSHVDIGYIDVRNLKYRSIERSGFVWLEMPKS